MGGFPVIQQGAEIHSPKYEVAADAVLVPKLNPNIARVWLPFPSGNYRAIASTEFLVLRPKSAGVRSYLFGTCERPEFLAELAGRADGASNNHKRLKPDDFMNRPGLVPDFETLLRFDRIVAPLYSAQELLRQRNRILRTTRDLLLPRLWRDRRFFLARRIGRRRIRLAQVSGRV